MSRGTLHAIPNDPLFGNQWHLRNTGQTGGQPDADIDADEAWDVALPSPGEVVRVAVVDMGFFYTSPFNHPDEEASWVVRGYDAVGNDWEHPAVDYDPTAGCRSFVPDCWHGTAVLGVIASATNNGVGIAGVMPGVPGLEYVAVKGWDNFGWTTYSLLAAAFRALKNNPYRSDIVICAWELPEYSDTLEQALYELHDAGSVVLFSSGNHFWIPYPAYSEYTFAVGATNDSDIVVDRNRGQDWVSGQGYELEVVAPGTWIWSWDLTGLDGWIPFAGECSGFYDYNCEFTGTSAAVAVAGGVAAMVRCRLDDRKIKYGKAARDSVMKVLRGSSEDQVGDEWDTPGWDKQYGHGRVNAYRALLSVIHGDVNNDAVIDSPDLAVLTDMIFFGGHATLDDRTGDWNCDGFVDSIDMSLLIDHVFLAGPPPGICFSY